LRSDREHCASRVAVEQEEEERRGGDEQATDIKSNNPHLAGGEKWNLMHTRIPIEIMVCILVLLVSFG